MHLPCTPCDNRNIACSRTATATTSNDLRPRLQKYRSSEDPIGFVSALSSEETVQLVELYLRFVHDRPHSLFHEKSLWEEIRMGTIPVALLLAICAVGCRFADKVEQCNLSPVLTTQSSFLFSRQLEEISLANIQTTILLANLYAATQKNELEALYYGKIAECMELFLALTRSRDWQPHGTNPETS